MGRPKASEARDTRQDILDAALELFAETGFFGTSMRDIARAVGVRESAIYHHFANKEALLAAIMTEAGQETVSNLDTALAGAGGLDLRTLLERLSIGALEKFSTLKQRKLFRIMMSDGLRLASQGRFNFIEGGGGLPRQTVIRFMQQLLDEGRVRGASAEFMTIEWIAPILLWRQMQIVLPSHPWISDYRTFARQHIDHFLLAVVPEALNITSHKTSDRSATAASEPATTASATTPAKQKPARSPRPPR